MLKLKVNVNSCDYDKRTALHVAVSNNSLELVKVLLNEININVNPIDNFDLTPMRDAEIRGFKEMI